MSSAVATTAATTSCPKREGSRLSLSSRIQAWQASAGSTRKHSPSVEPRFSCTRTGSRGMIGSRVASYIHSHPQLTSDSDSECSNYYSSDDRESVPDLVDERNTRHEQFSVGKGNVRDTVKTPSSSPSKTQLGSSALSTSTELGEIQKSVRRLRAQRTNVEQLGQRNEELECQLSGQKAENDTLQREVLTLRGTELENVAYLQSVKLLEQRTRGLEEVCNAKKLELKDTAERISCVEQERDHLRQELQNTQQDHEEDLMALNGINKKLLQRIEQHEHLHRAQIDDRKRIEHHWKHRMKAAARASSQAIDTLQQQLEQSHKQYGKLETEVRELEEQVQNLLATTVRQTTVIEECDRVISETKAQQEQSQRSYEEQLQLTCELSAKTQRLEVQVVSLKLSKGSEALDLEKKMTQLECKLSKRNDQLEAAKEVLHDKEKEIEVMQRAYVSRDHDRLHTDEVNKRNDRKLKSEISELQIAQRDASHENNLLSEQVLELQEQLESERKDRSRWATARLKLLAEFCDEESKLSSALTQHQGVPSEGWRPSHERRSKTELSPSRKTKSKRVVRSTPADDQSYDGDDSEDEERHSSIVFG